MTNSDDVQIQRALLSVSDKSGLVDLAVCLKQYGVEIFSTGGTAKTLRDSHIPVNEIADYTKAPEIMAGRVKTLHPLVHGGILARRDHVEDQNALKEFGISTVDLVVVNLYPFEKTIAAGSDEDAAIENIDIGGPAMIRSAAKNHKWVTIVTDPSDYLEILDELDNLKGRVTLSTRKKLARLAFSRTAAYDAAITTWFNAKLSDNLPDQLIISAQRRELLRYGENPHQDAAFYVTTRDRAGVGTARQIQGKSLSYNNLNDTDTAFELVAEFESPAVAIIKHANPCGVALGSTPIEAYIRALNCDKVSAFGGIVAFNSPIDGITAKAVTELFSEVVIAPDADEEAKEIFSSKNNLRLLLTGSMPKMSQKEFDFRSISGGILVQNRDLIRTKEADLKVVTKRTPTPSEMDDLLFAFQVSKHVKSNAIVFAKNYATIGIGAGQMSRVDSSRIGAWKARETARSYDTPLNRLEGSVVASDAFFPFPDGLLVAIKAGAKAVIQPGGSIRDKEIIKAADSHNVSMVFTGTRHFRH